MQHRRFVSGLSTCIGMIAIGDGGSLFILIVCIIQDYVFKLVIVEIP